MLNNVDARQKFFAALSEKAPGDIGEVSKVKSKISQMVQREAEEMGFKEQLNKEELATIGSETFDEVATHSNFFFKINENKKNQNLKVFDWNAPGNKYRHPNVILPHECVDVQRPVNLKELTPEKLTEVYAYYSLLVDLHIAQVRPGIIDDANYVPAQYNYVSTRLINP